MILPLENQDLFLPDICLVGATFLFTFFPLKVPETTHPLELLYIVEQTVHCSNPANALVRLRLFANTAPVVPFKTRADRPELNQSRDGESRKPLKQRKAVGESQEGLQQLGRSDREERDWGMGGII
ncbi:hypothetical protein BHM03_00026623 [Ensete ventricosum]|nr:hypothetical protein BHM03_00026623 [Ensete ventricosum]